MIRCLNTSTYFVLIVFSLLFLSDGLYAQEWTGAAGDQDWFNTTNWDGGVVPNSATAQATIPNGLANYPSLTGPVELAILTFSGTGSGNPAQITLNSHDLTIRERLWIDKWDGSASPRQIGTNISHTGKVIIQPNSTTTRFISNGTGTSKVEFNAPCEFEFNGDAASHRNQSASTTFNNTLTVVANTTNFLNFVSILNTYNADVSLTFTGNNSAELGYNNPNTWPFGGLGGKDTYNQNLTITTSGQNVGLWADITGDLTVTTSASGAFNMGETVSSSTVTGTASFTSNNTSGNAIRIAYNVSETVTFNGNVNLTSTTANGRIDFGKNGAVTLGANASMDASSTTAGRIDIKNTTQTTGGTPSHNFTTNDATDLYFTDNTLHGDFTAEADMLDFKGNTIGTGASNTVSIRQVSTGTDIYNNGGNIFNGGTTISNIDHSSNRDWRWGVGNPDIFNGNLTVETGDERTIDLAYSTTGNQVNGNLTISTKNGTGSIADGGGAITVTGTSTFTVTGARTTDTWRQSVDIAENASSTVELQGNVNLTQPATGNIRFGDGFVVLNGTADQTITSATEVNFNNLRLDKTSGNVHFAGTANQHRTEGELDFETNNKAEFYLNDIDYLIYDGAGTPNPGTITNASATTGYIAATGTGRLFQRVVNADKLFPIGTASSYMPITLNNGGTADQYGIRLEDLTSAPYSYTGYFVNNAWDIEEETTGGSDLTIVAAQWPSGEEMTNFNNAQSALYRWNGSNFDALETQGAAGGGDPYTKSIASLGATNSVGILAVATSVSDAHTSAGNTMPSENSCGFIIMDAVEAVDDSGNPFTGPGKWSQPNSATDPAVATFADDSDPNTIVSGLIASGTYTFRWTTSHGFDNITSDVVVTFTYTGAVVPVTATWTGIANNGKWDDCTNWLNNENPDLVSPGVYSNVIIPGFLSTQYPTLSTDVTVRDLAIQSGAELNLDSYTLNFNGSSNVDGATITSNGGTFEKIGTSNDTWAGGNTFTGDITFKHSGTGGDWILAGTNADDFNAINGTTTNTITFDIANASANIIPAYNGNTTIEGNIVINSIASTDFHFGDIGGGTGGITLDGGSVGHNRITTIDNNLPLGQKIVYYNFTIDKDYWGAGVDVDGISHIQNELTLTEGRTRILDGAIFSLQNDVANALKPSSFTDANVIIARGTGVFGRKVLNNGTDYIFPLGNGGFNGTVGIDRRFWSHRFEYTLNLDASSTPDEFFIRLGNPGGNPKATYDVANSGSGANLNQEYINNTWIVTHANTSASFDALVKVFWYHDEPFRLYEQATFEPTRAFITRYDYGSGEWKCLQEATAATENSIGTPTITNRENRLELVTGVDAADASNGNFGVFSIASATADVSSTSTSQTVSCGTIDLDASAIFKSAAGGTWSTLVGGVVIVDPNEPITTAVNVPAGTHTFTWTRGDTDGCGTNIHSEDVDITITISGTASTTQTWTGAFDTNWFNCANWTDGVPVAATDVIIPNDAPRYPVLTADVTGIQSLTFDDNGTTTGATIDLSTFNLNTGTLEVKDWTTGTVDRTIVTGTGTFNINGRFIVNGRTSRVTFDAPTNLANLAGDTNYSYLYDVDFEKSTSLTNKKTSSAWPYEGIVVGGNDATDETNFNGELTLVNEGESRLTLAYNRQYDVSSIVNLNRNVIFTSTATGGHGRIQLGSDDGTQGNISLADGKTLTTSGFSSGQLLISQVTQTGATKTHTHDLDQTGNAELRLRENTLLGNFDVEAPFMEYRNNIFNTDATNTTKIVGTTISGEQTFSGGNTFNGVTEIENKGQGNMYFGHSNGDPDIFETDASFKATESSTASITTVPLRDANYSTTYSTTFSTPVTSYTTSVDYITASDYYVFGTDPASWSGTKVGFGSYPRTTILPTNNPDPVVNANNANTNFANDAANKADETTSEANIELATDRLEDAKTAAETAEDDLDAAIASATAALAAIATDPAYTGSEGSTVALYNALNTTLTTGSGYVGTVTGTITDADSKLTDTTNPPGEDQDQANISTAIAKQAHDYVNDIYQAILDLHNEVNTLNAAVNTSLAPSVTVTNNTGALFVANESTGNLFKGNTTFEMTNKGRIFLANSTTGDAVFSGTVAINNSSEGGFGYAFQAGDNTGADIEFQDDVNITQVATTPETTGNIRIGRRATVDFQQDLNINLPNDGDATDDDGRILIGENNGPGVGITNITLAGDLNTTIEEGLLELSGINKTSTTAFTLSPQNDAQLWLRGTSTWNGIATITDNSTEQVLIAPNTDNNVTFENDVTLRNENEGRIFVSNNGNTEFKGNLIVENRHSFTNSYDEAIRLGNNGTVTLTNGTIKVGEGPSNGFTKGRLFLKKFKQLNAAAPQYIQLHDGTFGNVVGDAELFVDESTFFAETTFEAADIGITNSTLEDKTTLIVHRSGENSGGNHFKDLAFFEFRGVATTTPAFTPQWNIGRGGGDQFDDNVQFWNNGEGSVMRIAEEGPGNNFFGTQVTVINGNNSGANSNNQFSIGRLSTSIAEFQSKLILDNRDADGNITIAEQGAVTFKDDVIIQNTATGNWEGNLAIGGWSTGNYNGTVTFEPTSSLSIDAGTTWERGQFILRNVDYQPTTALNLDLECMNDTRLYLGPSSTFAPDVSGTAGRFFLNGATYNGTLNLTRCGPHWRATSAGGNTFNGDVHLINESSDYGEVLLANTDPDVYNANATFEIRNPANNRRGWIIPAYNSTVTFKGNVTVISDIDEDYTFTGTGVYTPSSGLGTGTVLFGGASAQNVVYNNTANAARTMEMRKIEMRQNAQTNTVTFDRDFTVSEQAVFYKGKIILGTNDMYIENSSDGSSVLVLDDAGNDIGDSHVVATGSGEVVRDVPATSVNVIFPVGKAGTGAYSPATIQLSANADTYRVRTYDNIYETYGTGPTYTPGATTINAQYVKSTWVIANGGTTPTGQLTLQWDPVDELPHFERSLVGVVRYNNTTNKWRCTQVGGGSSGTAATRNLRRTTTSFDGTGAYSVTTLEAEAPDITACGAGSAFMAATPLANPFVGEWSYVNSTPLGAVAPGIADENDPNTEITGLVSGVTYHFTWNNQGLEGSCGTANLTSDVDVTVGSAVTVPNVAVTWIGAGTDNDNDWFDCANWEDGSGNNFIPTVTNNVIIPDLGAAFNYPSINQTGAVSDNLTAQNNASVTINTGGELTIYGDGQIDAGATLTNLSASGLKTDGADNTNTFTLRGTVEQSGKIEFHDRFVNEGLFDVKDVSPDPITEFYHNWENNAPFDDDFGRVFFKGDMTTTFVLGTTDIELNEMIMDKDVPATPPTIFDQLFLYRAITVTNALTLNNGIIYGADPVAKIIIIDDAVSTEGKRTATEAAYVSAPVRKIGDDAFVFPVGRSGSLGANNYWQWARFEISDLANTNISDYFEVEYHIGASPCQTCLPATMTNVSKIEYWTADRSGNTEAKVSIYWEDAGFSSMGDLSNLKLAKKEAPYNSGLWIDVPRDALNNDGSGPDVTPGGKGKLTSTNRITSFSTWTFGSFGIANNPLPVELVGFQAEARNMSSRIEWTALDEFPDEEYILQRSENGRDFVTVDTIAANGTLGTHEYQHYDHPPLEQSLTWYYRLKYTSIDGSTNMTPIRVVFFDRNQLSASNTPELYPNPISTNNTFSVRWLSNISEKVKYNIMTLNGQQVQTGILEVQEGLNNHNFQLNSNLSRGMYHLSLIHQDGTVDHCKLVVE